MRTIWTTPAREQLTEAITHIAEDNPYAAIMLDDEVDKTVLRLEQFPFSGRIGRLADTREAIIGSYILVYEVHHDFILVTHFVHSSRLFPPTNK